MGLTDWFRRLFKSPPAFGEDPESLRAEYGEGGLPGLARVEEGKAEREALEADGPPTDPTS